jgi:penicillin G amidase
LSAAYAETTMLLGDDSKRWQWGRLHQSLPQHVLAQAVDESLRARLQPGPFPVGGSAYTPNQSTYRVSDFRLTNGPTFRMVLDVGNWDASKAVNYPGQSGNSNDAHYADLTQLWLRGEYFPLTYSRVEVEKVTERRIRLRRR